MGRIALRYEIRWHGRGGQGAVTASMVLAMAAIYEGKYAQAFPEFGAERRGAPVKAYTRIGDEPILTRAPILNPDIVVVLDPSLPKELYLAGVKDSTIFLINTKKNPREIAEDLGVPVERVYTVNATKIALEVLKVPIVNTAMVGALVHVVPLVKLESVKKAVLETFPGRLGEVNVLAVERAYEEVAGKIVEVNP
ncbi:MAG: 2-oxoacid:acceptor oxidoreductase family protein [Desulfurococcales archaeon]|nr:2-oxoacid:acceptor oxidoreductase family protein [Desulfurococcales archaeon]